MIYHSPPILAVLRAIFVSVFLNALVLMSGCDSSKSVPVAVAAPAKKKALEQSEAKPTGRRFNLTLAGYNYTNRYIDDYRVNGQGGGNLDVSQPGSSGGGSVCCVMYFDTVGKKTVQVRWQSGACYFMSKSTISNDTYRHIHSFYKEVAVLVERSNTRAPNYLEVHFYPDGTVRAVVTETTSPPRMIVDPASEDRSEFPRCPNDKEPL